MRVKEHPTAAEMGKKRNKTKQNDYHNTSDEDILKGKTCAHIDKSVNLSGIKKGLKQAGGISKLGQCLSCVKEKTVSEKRTVASNDDSTDQPGIPTWLCLVCGNQGCGRGSQHQHALKHYETPRSSSHNLSLCLENMAVWCYKCDESVFPDDSRKLQECVDWVRKEMGAPKIAVKKKSKDTDGESTPTKGPLMGGSTPANSNKQDGGARVKGLNNLGNTCFFNAIMQNITQTNILRELLHEKWTVGKEVQIPEDTHLAVSLDGDTSSQMHFTFDQPKRPEDLVEPVASVTVSLPAPGSLTTSLISFLDEMNKAGKTNIINPRGLFNQICQKASRFKGYQQQDSHELLRYLLDGMRAEEIKRMQEAILAHFDIKSSKVKNLDEATKRKIKAYGHHCRHTFVDSIFSGQLLSSVHCNECQVVSEVYEPFLDLSLPIVESKGKRNMAPPRFAEKQPTLLEQSQEVTTPVALATGGKETEAKPSKHQVQKAREKAKKDAKRKHRKSQSGQQNPSPTQGEAAGETPAQSEDEAEAEEGEEEVFQDSNDADSETSLFDRPDRKAANVDFVRTVRTTSSTYGLANSKALTGGHSLPGGDARKDKMPVGNGKAAPSRDQTCDSREPVDTDEETDNLVGKLREMTLDGDSAMSTEHLRYADDSPGDKPTATERVNGNNSCFGSSVDPKLVSNAAERKTSSSSTTVAATELQAACNGAAHSSNSTGDSSGKDADALARLRPRPKPQESEADKLGVACGFGPARLAKQEDFSPPVSPTSPTRTKVTSTLAPRYQGKSLECSVESCLSQFTVPEWLTGANKFGCEHCSKNAVSSEEKDKCRKIIYTDASKQLLIHQPPTVLTLHLKRFQQVGYSLRKITRHINFPLVLDLAPFCSTSCKPYSDENQQVLYALYGIVEHSGRLHFGHYTAYVKARQPSEALRRYVHSIPRNLNAVSEHQKKAAAAATTTGLLNGDSSEPAQSGHAPGPAPKRKVTPPEGRWYYISDSHISEVPESKVLSAQAYILFYERILS